MRTALAITPCRLRGCSLCVGAAGVRAPMKLIAQSLALPEVKLIKTTRISDPRGYFAETYVRRDLVAAGIAEEFVQDNQSLSRAVGTIRGLHFQAPPFAQAKLVRVLRGRIWDVCVDLRRSSQRYGQHVAVELSAESGDQLYVPAGFAHGVCALEPETEVFYKVDALYSAAHERGIRWSDPILAIDWPIAEDRAILSDKDKALPFFGDTQICFE